MIAGRIKTGVKAIPLFWKIYGFILILLIVVVSLTELVLEPVFDTIFGGISGDRKLVEFIVWVVSIAISSVACGYIFSKALSNKLGQMATASQALSRGNLKTRLPETGNTRDAFDILAHNFNEMADAIKVQQHNDRRLLADISHELHSPLTRMAVATDLLSLKHKDEESEVIILRLAKEIRQMNECISLLLGQARDNLLYSGAMSAVDMSELIGGLVHDFSFQSEMQGVRINPAVEDGLVVFGHEVLVERMLGNVLSNAIFYSPAHSVIELDAKRAEGNVSIVIRDFGPGVPEEQVEEIFKAFYRVDSSRARFSGGVGLGLAIAMEAAMLLGGNIVAGNAHPGLRVTVTLPEHCNGNE